MKTRHLFAVTTALVLVATAPVGHAQAPAPAAPAANPIVSTLKARWQGVRDKVTNICDIIPEEKLSFRATPDVRSFEELIEHIAGEGYSFLRTLGSVPGVTPPSNQELAALTGKAALMKALRDSYEWQGKVIDSLTDATATEMAAGRSGAPGTTPKWASIVALIEDNMDHYGNLVTYVRLNGLVPPSTAAAAARRGGGGGAAAAPARGQ